MLFQRRSVGLMVAYTRTNASTSWVCAAWAKGTFSCDLWRSAAKTTQVHAKANLFSHLNTGVQLGSDVSLVRGLVCFMKSCLLLWEKMFYVKGCCLFSENLLLGKTHLLFCEKLFIILWEVFVLYHDSHCHKLICHWTAVLHLEHWHTGSYRYSDVAVVESTHKAMFVPFISFLLSIVIINSH